MTQLRFATIIVSCKIHNIKLLPAGTRHRACASEFATMNAVVISQPTLFDELKNTSSQLTFARRIDTSVGAVSLPVDTVS